MARAGAETVGLSKRGEPQEGNMTHATPDTSLCQLTPRRGRILSPGSTLEPRIRDPVLPRAPQSRSQRGNSAHTRAGKEETMSCG